MKRIFAPLILLAGWFPLHASAVCFTVYEGDRIVYRDTVTPIDLAGPISDALPAKYPGGRLVINPENTHCTLISPVTAVDIRSPAEAPSPMASAQPVAPAQQSAPAPAEAGMGKPAPATPAAASGANK
jgi:hypothetical protein